MVHQEVLVQVGRAVHQEQRVLQVVQAHRVRLEVQEKTVTDIKQLIQAQVQVVLMA